MLGALTAVSLLFPLATAQARPPTAAPAAPSPEPARNLSPKIHKDLREQLNGKKQTGFLVRLKEGGDLGTAFEATGKADKGAQVLAAKSAHAAKSQAGLRSLLTARKAEFRPLWIVNAVAVKGDAALAQAVANLPEVESVVPDRALPPPAKAPGKEAPAAEGVEWNVDRVNAPRVWNDLGVRGDGIVVATIDTGVEYDHPDLVGKYRGRKADGTFDHNYNWFARLDDCGLAPCDWHGNGTHVTGTMVGGAGTIGVAPGAKWIAASVCNFEFCPESFIIEAGQWMVAPTDRSGANPRPDLAPHIVHNFWSGPSADRWWYKPVLDAWEAAGIFSIFGAGHGGPRCGTDYPPGNNANAYSAGAFDVNNTIAPFSSRGTDGGDIKPDIAAPGVDIRSAWPGVLRHRTVSSTLSASAHVAGAAALIWAAAPNVKGDVGATRDLLDGGAIDMDDTSCGGTAAENPVWGEGRLDVYAAARDAPALTAALRGTVTAGGAAMAGVDLVLTGPSRRKFSVAADGTYALPHLRPGTYKLTARKFGYDDATGSVTLATGEAAVLDLVMTAQQRHAVTGTVTFDGAPDSPVTLEALGTPELPVTTDAAGRYRVSLPAGTYTLKVTPPQGRCSKGIEVPITVTADMTKDIVLPRRTESFGMGCVRGSDPYVGGTTKLPITGRGNDTSVPLPFPFPFLGRFYDKAYVSGSGWIDFTADWRFRDNGTLPSLVSDAIFPFWDDLVVDADAGIYTAVVGTAPRRTFVVEWRNVQFHSAPAERVSFSALLGENGAISFRYRGVTHDLAAGSSATIGLEGLYWEVFPFSYNAPSLADGGSVTFTIPHGVLAGTVLDGNDGRPVPGAEVRIGGGARVTTAQDGTYIAHVPAGDHQITVAKEHYGPVTHPATVAAADRSRLDATLITGRVSASAGELDLVTPANGKKSATIVLTNLGTSSATYALRPTPAGAWLSATPAEGELPPRASVTVTVTADSTGLPAGTYRNGTLSVNSASGRNPRIDIPVTMVIPATRIAVDVGGTRDIADSTGERWTADRAHTPGGHGYVSTRDRTHSTTATIKDTPDQALFQRARESMTEYRFDDLPSGFYTIELGFADTRASRPGQRVFDVYAEGELAVPALDLALEVGARTATTRQYTVKVTDGRLNVRFVPLTGTPILNTIRVSERPDKTIP
ncbi:hypothetical protein Ssi02_21620 [Sinosporangium siamense]|uniref:alpha-amylase n=2 Tax=Sinosporangium siamense TaxID=1367973 RepID=A0A919RH92_9ACTN|nr:hypothetical protein Ssi02_21620 [Sinosporangium siamense]